MKHTINIQHIELVQREIGYVEDVLKFNRVTIGTTIFHWNDYKPGITVKDIEQRNSFLIRSIINYFVCLVTIVVTMFICFPIGL